MVLRSQSALPALAVLLLSQYAVLAHGATDAGADMFGDGASQGSATQGKQGKHKKKGEGWRLMRHSFQRTLSFEDTLGDWLFTAASMPLRDRVNLLPPVADRFGIAFHKRTIDTSDFTASFSLGATGTKSSNAADGYVALWLGNQNYSQAFADGSIVQEPDKNWQKGMNSKGLTLLGNKPTFQGLGLAFFEITGRQSVAAVWNDGSKSVSMSDFTSGSTSKELDWLNKVIQVKLAFTAKGVVTAQVAVHDPTALISDTTWSWASDGVKVDSNVKFQKDGTTVPEGKWSMLPGNKVQVEFEQKSHKKRYTLRLEGPHRAEVIQPVKDPRPAMMRFETGDKSQDVQVTWHDILSLPAGTHMQPKSYIGMTGYTGKGQFIEVDVHGLDVVNMDSQKVGEQDSSEAVEGGLDPEWLKLLESEKKFLDQATQGQAVVELTKFLTEHIQHYETVSNKLKSDLGAMEGRVESLGSDMANFVSLIEAFNFDASRFDPLEVKSHIKGIRAVLSKAAETGDAKLGAVHEAAKKLKEQGGGHKISEASKAKAHSLHKQAETVEVYAAQGARQTTIMLIILILAVGGLGSLFFGRMRYYEKKHYI